MSCLHRLLSTLLLAALLATACRPVQPTASSPSVAQPSPARQGLRPDAPEYARHDPYWVGYKSVTIGEGTDRPLQAGIWYPAVNPGGEPEEVTYTITPKLPLPAIGTPFVVDGHALLAAEFDDSGAPYPLVIFSHGFATNAAWYNSLIEHYASQGFIVIAPEHREQLDPELSDLWKTSIDRPLDIKRTLDFAERATAAGGEMAGMIDMQKVAVVGHSYGGYTALAMAGAQYDLDAFNARCAQLRPDDPLTVLCAPLVPHEGDMAARAGLAAVPQGLWPSFGDPRVKAIITMAGDSYLFDQAGLAKITLPMLAIGGTADTGTPYDWGVRPAYEYASSARKTLVSLEGAEHMITTSCDNMPWMLGTDLAAWVCTDPVWDKSHAIDLINHLSTAFLLAELKGDAAAAAALAAENVAFPGIQYETTAYAAAASAAAMTTKVDATMDRAMATSGTPGMALGIIKDGAVAYLKGFGVERVHSDQPVTGTLCLVPALSARRRPRRRSCSWWRPARSI
jgi:predicted dienelactone hydrolase